MPFLDETLPSCIDYGSAFGVRYAVTAVVDAADNYYPHLRHPYPIKRFESGYSNKDYDLILRELVDMFHRIGGMSGGFRMRDRSEFTTREYTLAPAFDDQPCQVISAAAGTWQIMVWYTAPGGADSTRRRVRKPRPGTVLVGIRDVAGNAHPLLQGVTPNQRWTVDNTRGVITLAANNQRAITGITPGGSTVITVGSSHGYLPGDLVHISGVVGTTELNGLRVAISSVGATTITVPIVSANAWISGGTVNTRPQTGEILTAGCEFDIPVRFETDLSGVAYSNLDVLSTVVTLVELLNPDPQ